MKMNESQNQREQQVDLEGKKLKLFNLRTHIFQNFEIRKRWKKGEKKRGEIKMLSDFFSAGCSKKKRFICGCCVCWRLCA